MAPPPKRRSREEIYRDFANTIHGTVEGSFQPIETIRKMEVKTVIRDSVNNPVSFIATEGGQGEFNVPVLPGEEVNENDVVYVSHTKGKLAAPNLKFVGLASSSSAGQSVVRKSKGLIFPSPEFKVPPTTSNLLVNPGSILSEVIVHFTGVEDKLSPTSYRVIYKLSSDLDWTTAWTDIILHQDTVEDYNLRLSRTFSPGTSLDIRMATVYSYLDKDIEADLSTTITIATATDNTDPGTISSINVDVNTPGMLVAQASGTQVSGIFKGYIYEVATSVGGPAIRTSPVTTGPFACSLPAGVYYVAAKAVSINNVNGTRFPSSGFLPSSGPGYTVLNPVIVDLTPPATWNAATIADVSEIDSLGTKLGKLKVTLPAYTYSGDYHHTIIKVVETSATPDVEVPYPLDYVPASPTGVTVLYVGFGTFVVYLIGVDDQGNQSTIGTVSNTVTIVRPGVPSAAGNVITSSIPSGIRLDFTIPTGAQELEVWRATSSGGAGAAAIASINATFYLDIFVAAGVAGTVYYYKITGKNKDGIGTFSSTWTAGTIGSLDGSTIVAGTVTGTTIANGSISTPKIQANAITSNEIAANAVIAGKVAANAITATEIAAGAVTAGKIAAGLVISDVFLTAASPATRIEIRGQTGVSPNQIQFHENVSSVDQLRGVIDGTGIYIYERISGTDIVRAQLVANGITIKGDGAQSDIKMYRHSGGRGRFESYGVTIGFDTVPFVDFNSLASSEVRFTGPTITTKIKEITGPFGTTAMGFEKLYGTIGDPVMILYDHVGGGSGSEKLALTWDGIESDNTAISPYTWKINSTNEVWRSNVGVEAATFLRAGTTIPTNGVQNYPIQTKSAILADAVNSTQPLQGWQFPFNSGSNFGIHMQAYRSTAATLDWQGARVLIRSEVDNFSFTGGSIQLGARVYAPFWSMGRGTTSDIFWDDTNSRIEVPGSLHITGTMSATSKSFVINHPDPKKKDTHQLRHNTIEGPTRGETIYTYVVEYDGETATVYESEGNKIDVRIHESQQNTFSFRLPDYWRFLNERPRTLTSKSSRGGTWNQAAAEVNAHETDMVIECQGPGKWNVLLIGTRKDEAARNAWDLRGVEKRKSQGWTAEGIMARRNGYIERRAERDRVKEERKKSTLNKFVFEAPNLEPLLNFDPTIKGV